MRRNLTDGALLALLVVLVALPAGERAREWWTVPYGDLAQHWFRGLQVVRQWEAGGGLLATLQDPPSGYYPPLSYVVQAAFGPEWLHQCRASLVWLAVLVASTYALTRALWGRAPALMSALLVGTAPLVLQQTGVVMLDLPAAAASTAALALLEASGRFARRGLSAVFGVGFGLALLVKWTVVLFVAPYAAVALLGRPRGWAHALLAGGAAAALAGAGFYLDHYDPLVEAYALHADLYGYVVHPSNFRFLFENDVWAGAVLLLEGAALAFVLVPEERRRALPLWVAMAVGSYCALALPSVAFGTRYLLPAVPLMAALSTGYLRYLRPPLRALALGAVAALGLWHLAGWAGLPGTRPVKPPLAPTRLTDADLHRLVDRVWDTCGEATVLVSYPPDPDENVTEDTMAVYAFLKGYPMTFRRGGAAEWTLHPGGRLERVSPPSPGP